MEMIDAQIAVKPACGYVQIQISIYSENRTSIHFLSSRKFRIGDVQMYLSP
jgi:hypothetical protein